MSCGRLTPSLALAAEPTGAAAAAAAFLTASASYTAVSNYYWFNEVRPVQFNDLVAPLGASICNLGLPENGVPNFPHSSQSPPNAHWWLVITNQTVAISKLDG